MTSTATDHLEKSPLHLPPLLPTTSTPSPHLLPRPTPWQRAKAVTHVLHGFITSYSTPIEEIDRLLTAVVVLVGCLIQLTCLVAICVWAVAMVVDGVMASYRGVEPREVDAVTLTVLVGAVFLVQGLLMLLAATDALFKYSRCETWRGLDEEEFEV